VARRYWRNTLIDAARCLPSQIDLAVSGTLQRLPELRNGYLEWVGPAARFANANFFGGALAEGLMKDSGGTMHHSKLVPGRPCLIVERGVATIYAVESLERARAASVAIGGGPVLLRDGQPTALANLVSLGQLQDTQYLARRPRNVIGITREGHIWQAGISPMTLAECQQMGVDFGLRDLMNLDGGDSMGVWEGSALTFGKAERRIVSALVMRQLLAEPLVPHGKPYHRLSTNFHESEFACKHCGVVMVADMLASKLQQLRDIVGSPVTITSGYRCEVHNRNVGGAPTSYHLKGEAADISCRLRPSEVARIAESVGFGGIKVYDTFAHVDIGPYRRW